MLRIALPFRSVLVVNLVPQVDHVVKRLKTAGGLLVEDMDEQRCLHNTAFTSLDSPRTSVPVLSRDTHVGNQPMAEHDVFVFGSRETWPNSRVNSLASAF